MATRGNKSGSGDTAAQAKTAAQLAGTVKQSAQQIWLAGLGAFSKAQEEGGKVFEALVQEGTTLQRKTQSAAEAKMAEAGSRMASVAADLGSKATGQWDKLENLFEDRVSRAMKNLHVPTSRDLDALAARLDELEARLGKLAKPAAKTPSAKAPAKRGTARKAT